MEWISVKDRLPDFGSEVLAIIPWTDGSFYSPFSCDFDGKFGFCDLWAIENDDRFYREFNEKVTHWMPLPEPPKE